MHAVLYLKNDKLSETNFSIILIILLLLNANVLPINNCDYNN